MPDELKEFEALIKPVVDWLKKNHNPHTTIIVTQTYAKISQDLSGIPFLKDVIADE